MKKRNSVFYHKPYRWIALFSIIIILGFLPSYAVSFYQLSNTHHWHGGLSLLWLILLTLQPLLIEKGSRKLHRILGWFGAGLALLLVVSTSILFIDTVQKNAAKGGVFQMVYWVDIFLLPLFIVLVTIGLVKRKQPDQHKRFMFLSVLVLLPPGLGRLIYTSFLFPFDLPMRYFYEPMMFILLIVLWFVGREEQWRYWQTQLVFSVVLLATVSAYFIVDSDWFMNIASALASWSKS
ncbi:hypothetical protein [Pleionea sp. CnH1-48]|uniref:hypothetical protein n=1 Tax=Pleionea sp. CnH1-48 TaxID=2954494 RepID=UPI002096C4BC|nr:hypothetical protein [Pleionea sp. CnH1-48]MCO7223017.1 hypothetical protein [Pleionea sp. CnH1-48]